MKRQIKICVGDVVKYHNNGEIGLIMAKECSFFKLGLKVLFPSGIWYGCDPEAMEKINE